MTEFLNARLYQCLISSVQNLPKDDASQLFSTLIDSLLFSLSNGENPQQLIKRIRRERHKKQPALQPLGSAQATLDMAEIKRLRILAKAKTLLPGARKLDQYRQEVQQLRLSGASHRDIKIWLLANRSAHVSQPTIQRYLKAIAIHDSSVKK